ncbi:MAG: DUF5719 family protein [Ferrimicrobium sp.]
MRIRRASSIGVSLISVIALAVVAMSNGVAKARSDFRVQGAPLGLAGLSESVVNPRASSVSWYCTSPALLPGVRKVSIVVSNPMARVGSFQLERGTAVPRRVVRIRPYGQVSYRFATKKAGFGRTIVASGGLIATVNYAETSGVQVLPCQSSPSTRWILPGLYTLTGDRSLVEIYNPFGSPAVVDVSALTPQGKLSVSSGSGIVIAPESVYSVSAASIVAGQSGVTLVVTVKSGRVVASGIVSRQDSKVIGVAAVAAVSLATRSEAVPQLAVTGSNNIRILLVNPSSTPAVGEVRLAPYRGSGAHFGLGRLRRIERVSVPASSTVSVNISAQVSALNVGSVLISDHVRRGPALAMVVTRVQQGQLVPFAEFLGDTTRSRSWWVACPVTPRVPVEFAVPDGTSAGILATVSAHEFARTKAPVPYQTNIVHAGIFAPPFDLRGAATYHIAFGSPVMVGVVQPLLGCTAMPGV